MKTFHYETSAEDYTLGNLSPGDMFLFQDEQWLIQTMDTLTEYACIEVRFGAQRYIKKEVEVQRITQITLEITR